MKRSERFRKKAQLHTMLASTILTGTCMVCVWSVAACLPSPAGGPLAAGLAAAGLALTWASLRDALRYARMSKTEAHWENQRSIRPRL